MKKWLSLLICVFMVSCLSIANAKAQPTVAKVHVTNENGEDIENALIFAYAEGLEGPELIGEYRTNTKGFITLPKPKIERGKLRNSECIDISLKIFSPGKQIKVFSWSEDIESLGSKTSSYDISLKEKPSGPAELTATPTALGSGIYRTVKIPAGSWYTNKRVPITEFHTIPGIFTELTYTSSNYVKVEVGIKHSGLDWEGTGSYNRAYGSSTTSKMNSTSQTSCCIASSEYQFEVEKWELQEQDTEFYDVWHTVESWNECKPVAHVGGLYYDSSPYTDYCNKDYNWVWSNHAGNRLEITTGGITKTCTKSWSTGGGLAFYGANLKVVKNASENITLEFKKTETGNYLAYDNDWSQGMWYLTKE